MTVATSDGWYFVYENRLASFNAPRPAAKRRGSNAGSRAPKSLSWPHKSPSPAELAKAGFVFDPHPDNPDNVVCFLCQGSYDGWEEDDEPVSEHLKHAPNCGWAVVSAVAAEVGDYNRRHPLEPTILDSRKATFAGRWPYESKKGFKCKTKQLAEAGWNYTPTLDSDDMTTCSYCHLALDGWESGDKPMEEHYKRAPDCLFFYLIDQTPAPKKGRATKATGASKPARLSMQSVATVTSEVASTADVTADHDDSVITTTSTMTQGGRKTTRGRKPAATKGKKTRAKKDDVVEILEDAQEAEMPPPPVPKPTRGRKRRSDAVEDPAATAAEAPAPKKRATRGRASTNPDASVLTVASQDTEMVDAPAKRQPGRKKKRGSNVKATRKVSSASLRSQASTASLRGPAPDDDEIERQLQADLERPLTDDENVAADSDSNRENTVPASAPKAKGKKGGSRKTAPKAEPEPEHSADYAIFDPAPPDVDEAQVDAELEAMKNEADAHEAKEEAAVLQVPKKGRKAGTRKASKQTKKAKEPALPPPDPVDEPTEEAVMLVEPVPAPAPAPQPEIEVEDDSVVSNGTVVTKTTAPRLSTGKRGRGRPPKKSVESQGGGGGGETEEAPVRAPSTDVEVEIETVAIRQSLSPSKRVSSKVISHTPTGPPPARADKALPPPPPPFSITRKPMPQPSTPRANHASPAPSAKQATLSPSPSPQSSDAENRPPSSRPSTTNVTISRIPLAPVVSTPVPKSPSRRNVVAGLQTTTPWAAADLDLVFSPHGSPDKENGVQRLLGRGADLATPEKQMTVEEWIYHNAGLAEQKLRHECEAMVSTFEKEGTRAMGALEGLVVD